MTIQQVLAILGYWAIWDFSDRKVRLVVHCTGIVLFAGTVDDVWNWLEVTRQYRRDKP
jgi:hypothetical protein